MDPMSFVSALPAAMPSDRHVLVVANKDVNFELKHLKPLIDEMNGRDDWIRLEEKNSLSESAVTVKCAVVLVMVGTTENSFRTAREGAKKHGITCVVQHLTKNQIRHALEILKERRVSAINGAHKAPQSAVDRRTPLLGSGGKAPTAPVVAGSATAVESFPDSGTLSADERPSVLLQAEDELKAAQNAVVEMKRISEAAIDQMRKVSDDAGVSMLAIVERFEAVVSELREIREQMEAKDRDYKILQDRNTFLQGELAKKSALFAELQPILDRYRK